MNRETEAHFSNLPSLSIKRSSFKRPHDHKTSFNASELIPIYIDSDILPGDSIKMNMASIVRMQTPIFPVFDNCYMDVYWFFVPHRLVWTHWREFWGENRTTHWVQPTTYTIPQIVAPSGGWTTGTLADYMGLPINVSNISVSHLPFRAYCQIVNDWFVDENLKDPCYFTNDETTVTGTNSGSYVTNTECGAKPFKAAKFHDYFTSCLPSPQKSSQSVTIPLGTSAPVCTGPVNTRQNNVGVIWGNVNGSPISVTTGQSYQMNLYGDSNGNPTTVLGSTITGSPTSVVIPSNLYADLQYATAATINQLRQAFAVQAFYEAQARGGWAAA